MSVLFCSLFVLAPVCHCSLFVLLHCAVSWINTQTIYNKQWTAISLWINFEIISGRFPRAEIKIFQTEVDEGWNNFEILFYFTCNHGIKLWRIKHTQRIPSKMTGRVQKTLTLSFPTFFSECGKMSLPKCSAPHWSDPPFLIFWHSGTLALSPARQSARVSKN